MSAYTGFLLSVCTDNNFYSQNSMKCARKKPQMKRGLSPRPVSKTSQQKTPSCTICGQPATANPDPDSHVTEIDDKSHRQPYLWLFVSSKMMENAQSAHRFQVTKVEEGSIQNPEPLNESDAHQTVQTSDVDKADEAPVKFSIGDDAEGADAFTFGKNTLDAIPHVDHYRNHHSACMPLKVRPSLADLHEAKVSSSVVCVYYYNYFEKHLLVDKNVER